MSEKTCVNCLDYRNNHNEYGSLCKEGCLHSRGFPNWRPKDKPREVSMGSSCYKCKYSHISPHRKPCDTCNIKSEWKPRPKETPKEDSMKVNGAWTIKGIYDLGPKTCDDFRKGMRDFFDFAIENYDVAHAVMTDCTLPGKLILEYCGKNHKAKDFAIKHGIVEEEEKRYKKGQWFTWDRMTEDSRDKYLMLLEDDTQSDINTNELLVSGRSGLTFNLCLDFTPIDKSEVKL